MAAEHVGQVDPNWPPPAYDPSDDIDTTPPTEGARPTPSRWLVAAGALAVGIGAAAVFIFAGQDSGTPSASSTPPSAAGPSAATSAAATSGANAGTCGPDEAAALAATLPKLQPDKRTGKPWDSKPQSSNYNPCADLSAVVLTVQGATASSPDLALLFHRGTYVGTATPSAYPFTELEAPASTNDTVVLTYRTRQSCSTCLDGTLTVVGFKWDGDRVQVLDRPPEPLETPP
ncbi:hypothetical protein BST27_17435 [Mycobacterium intermedium]|uniref:LppP/LprE family lipoprotein n=1 Tax=Mycobacterium intermedium TaxID=28445 RepID=A0A1E3S8C7_MYCIE|nr:LppP/LprE family lipoprotein [Mycobacterium intermedium]MCV6966352.1 LppP/LprE family lipoprotein [Mycobacterium intermedium]ODQ98418.1 hypothetical protein BHQ20_22200 [Mycobacterium intermedium]OPE45538.1 hypothetical protein BV508_29250 [Mycobacterium intermedium]ORB01496.1 hypothetical protein BST27_17435 [Mycobacterium intermedium]